MTIEEAIRILDPETTAEELAEIEYYGGFLGYGAKVQAVNSACELAVDALRAQQELENPSPLTLDDLFLLCGMPVFVHYEKCCTGYYRWAIVDKVDIQGKTLYCEGLEPFRNYGKDCIAYRYNYFPRLDLGRQLD